MNRRTLLLTLFAVPLQIAPFAGHADSLDDVFEALLKVAYNTSAVTVHGVTRDESLAGLDEAEFPWLYGMWRDKPIWWFVQWPVLGHGNAHVGEGISVRNRMGLSPF